MSRSDTRPDNPKLELLYSRSQFFCEGKLGRVEHDTAVFPEVGARQQIDVLQAL